jgi:DinB superfamily
MEDAKSLIDALAAEFAHERSFIDGLPETSRHGHGTPDAWSAKDLQDHITAWKHQTVLRLREDPSAVVEESDEDTDRANAEFMAGSAAQSWETVLAAAHTTHATLNQALPELSDSELADTERYAWQDGLPLWRRLAGTLLLHPWMHLAEHAIERGQPDTAAAEALAMVENLEPVSGAPDWAGVIHYNAACILSRAGHLDQALDQLQAGLTIRPDMIAWSKQDSDLEPLRSDDRLASLYASLEG